MGGGFNMLFAAGVLGVDATSVGPKVGRARMVTLDATEALRSIADAALDGGPRGGAIVPLGNPLEWGLLTLGDAVWAREGGGGGADVCGACVPAWNAIRFYREAQEACLPFYSPSASVLYHSRSSSPRRGWL